MRIVFMGTPDFAVETLRRLVEAGRNVVTVVTMPDKPRGRHQSASVPSPVKAYATERGIPVLQPERLSDPAFLESLRRCRADLQVVVAFRMLPEVVWAMPRLGTFNLHASLLPQYRGAAPINWAIINGESMTGVTTFLIDRNIDTGVILRREQVPIFPTDNAAILHDRLMRIGAELALKTIDDIQEGNVSPIPQSQLTVSGSLMPAPKLRKETCELQFSHHTVASACDFVRGLSPYPGAWTTLFGKQLKIYEAMPCYEPCNTLSGEIDTDGRTFLHFACSDGWLSAQSLQLEGRRRMPIADFLRGCNWQL